MRCNSDLAIVVAVSTLAFSGASLAVDYTWISATGGKWSDTNNWSGGGAARGAANAAVFNPGVAADINVDTNTDVGVLRFMAGSQFRLVGTNTLGVSAVESYVGSPAISIGAPIVAPPSPRFMKSGDGIVMISNLTAAAAGVSVNNGTLMSRTLDSTAVGLGNAGTPTNGSVRFLLTNPGDYVNGDVNFEGWGNNFARELGGANTNGEVYYNWIHADPAYLTAQNELFLTAAAGGLVQIYNVKGNSTHGLVKTGPGALRILYWGSSSADHSYAGGTIVRNGALLLGEDDIGNTTNGFVLPNGRTSNGAGGSLGYENFVNPIQMGDSSYTLTGSGADIEDVADGFCFLHGTQSGNGQLVAQVRYIQNTDGWAKGGLMMRDTYNVGSRNVTIAVTPANGVIFQWRDSDNGLTVNVVTNGLAAPKWVKLTRLGDVFTGYVSDDGRTWAVVGSASVGMSAAIEVGLAVTAHNNAALCKAIFENVEGLPGNWSTSDIGTGFPAGSGTFIGTGPSDDVSLLVAKTRWVGHDINVNSLARSVSLGMNEPGACTFAGTVNLKSTATLVSPANGWVTFTGSLGGSGGIVKAGAGTVEFAGNSTYYGTTVVSNGQLLVTSPAGLSSNTAVTVVPGAQVLVTTALVAGASVNKGGSGMMVLSAPQSYAGQTVVSGGILRLGHPGLYEGWLSGRLNTTDSNPMTSVQLSTRYANATDTSVWSNNSTYVYSGWINNSAPTATVFAFAEQFDDDVLLKIDGATVLYDTTWNKQTSSAVLLSSGWHAFELRLGQGSLGVGPANGGIDGTTGLGVAYSNAASGGWKAISDNTGNFLDTGASTAGYLSPSTTVAVLSGGTLDLNRSAQTVAGVSGSGIIADGQVNVTGQISPGDAGAIGTLTVQGNLSVWAGTVHNWDCTTTSSDMVAVSGVLTLPAVATLNVNRLEGKHSERLVLYTFGSYNGPMDLRGWTVVNANATVVVNLVTKQVILMPLATLMIIN